MWTNMMRFHDLLKWFCFVLILKSCSCHPVSNNPKPSTTLAVSATHEPGNPAQASSLSAWDVTTTDTINVTIIDGSSNVQLYGTNLSSYTVHPGPTAETSSAYGIQTHADSHTDTDSRDFEDESGKMNPLLSIAIQAEALTGEIISKCRVYYRCIGLMLHFEVKDALERTPCLQTMYRKGIFSIQDVHDKLTSIYHVMRTLSPVLTERFGDEMHQTSSTCLQLTNPKDRIVKDVNVLIIEINGLLHYGLTGSLVQETTLKKEMGMCFTKDFTSTENVTAAFVVASSIIEQVKTFLKQT